MIKIDFEIQNEKYGVYRDALYLAEDHGLSDAQIEEMKQERYDNWLDAVENPPVVEVPEIPPPPANINIGGQEYVLLDGTPPSGASVIEVNGVWYVKA